MFKDVPKDIEEGADPVAVVLGEMDHFGIERAMLGVSFEREHVAAGARRSTPTASSARFEVDPNRGMEGVRELVQGRTRSSASRPPPRSPRA